MAQAIVTVIAVINPVVCGTIFLTLTPKLTRAQRHRSASRVALSILIILVCSALIGLKVLGIFNISIDVFQIVGGMIIAYMGFDMLGGGHTVGQAPPTNDETTAPSPLSPLIMFAAGPGTITAVVTLAAVHTPDSFPLTAIVAAVIGAVVTFAALLLAVGLEFPCRSRHAGHDYPFHGAHRGVYGHAVRADRVKGVLESLVGGSIDAEHYPRVASSRWRSRTT